MDAMREELDEMRRFGHDVQLFEAEEMRAEVASPTYLGGLWDRTGAALVHPGRLAAGLRDAAMRAGVRVFEHSPATRLERSRATAWTCTWPAPPCGHGGCCWPPVRTPRCCGRCAATCCRCTTTCWSRSRWTGRAARPSGGGGARAWATPRIASTTTGSPPTTASCGAATTPSIGTAARSAVISTTTTPPSRSCRSTSSPRSLSSRGSGSPIAGAARSTPAAASPCSSAPPTAAAWPTPPGTPAWAWPRRASARAWRWISWTGARRRPPGSATSAAGRCPSRPSRFAQPWWASPRTASRRPTRTPAAVGCGSARWIARGSASTFLAVRVVVAVMAVALPLADLPEERK